MDFVILNISGTIFRIHKNTFCRLPSNCFENITSFKSLKYDEGKETYEEYYLDRHAESFTAIVWFYTNGELHMPSSVCPSVFCRELQFWQIDERKMSRCCYMKYVSFFEDQALLKTFETEETKADTSNNVLRPSSSKWEYTRRKIWRILDDPLSSICAKVYVSTSAVVILISIFVLVASTHPIFQRELNEVEWKEYLADDPAELERYQVQVIKTKINEIKEQKGKTTSKEVLNKLEKKLVKLWKDLRLFKKFNSTSAVNEVSINFAGEDEINDENGTQFVFSVAHTRYKFLTIMDYFTVAFFLVELAVRIIFCPDRRKFFRSFLNIVDMIALTSEIIVMFIEYMSPQERYTDISSIDFVESFQIARVFRLFRLVKNFIGFRVFIYSVRASFKNMALMVFLMFVAALIFSAVIFYCDRLQFPSIPDAIWWAVVTMTTVGYGDIVPKSLLGKMIGCLCAVTGVFVLAVLIPVLVSNFILFIGFARIPLRKQKHDLANLLKQEFVFSRNNTKLQTSTKKNKLKVYNASNSPQIQKCAH